MATVKDSDRFVEFDAYVDFQMDKTRKGVKWTDILTSLAMVAVFGVTYLLAFVVVDQWVIEGGIPDRWRTGLFCVVILTSVVWLAVKAVWPLWRRVNDLYAAQMLEQAEPNLQGHLMSLVDSRRAGYAPAEEIRSVLEKRSATTLSQMDVDAALNRTLLMRVLFVLLAVVVIAGAYAIFSPKRIGPSLLRAMLPSSRVAVATKTEILDVRPQDVTILAGSRVEVTVQLRGEKPKTVWLFYSTKDRKFVDEPVEMTLKDETTRTYVAALAGSRGEGLTQDMTYRIEAGDASTRVYEIEVGQPPSAVVEQIRLTYPGYTRVEPSNQTNAAIEGIEGTDVEWQGRRNRPLKSAKLVFSDDASFQQRSEEVPLTLSDDKSHLTARWTLRLRDDGSFPQYYRVECRDERGHDNPNPAVFPIKIFADQPPEIAMRNPTSDLERPANAVIPLVATANDPDFELRDVTMHVQKGNEPIPGNTVLWEGEKKQVVVKHNWELDRLGLKAGDVVSFYLQARDNREPDGNRRNAPQLTVRITDPVSEEDVQKQLQEDQQQQAETPDGSGESEENPNPQADAEMPPDEGTETGEEERPEAANQQDGKEGEKNSNETEGAGEENRTEKDVAHDAKRSEEPVKSDGSEDDRVLREILKHQQQDQMADGSEGQEGASESSSSEDQSGKSNGEGQDSSKPSKGGEGDSKEAGSDEGSESENGAEERGAEGSQTSGKGSDEGAGKQADGSRGGSNSSEKENPAMNDASEGAGDDAEGDGGPQGSAGSNEGSQEDDNNESDADAENRGGGTARNDEQGQEPQNEAGDEGGENSGSGMKGESDNSMTEDASGKGEGTGEGEPSEGNDAKNATSDATGAKPNGNDAVGEGNEAASEGMSNQEGGKESESESNSGNNGESNANAGEQGVPGENSTEEVEASGNGNVNPDDEGKPTDEELTGEEPARKGRLDEDQAGDSVERGPSDETSQLPEERMNGGEAPEDAQGEVRERTPDDPMADDSNAREMANPPTESTPDDTSGGSENPGGSGETQSSESSNGATESSEGGGQPDSGRESSSNSSEAGGKSEGGNSAESQSGNKGASEQQSPSESPMSSGEVSESGEGASNEGGQGSSGEGGQETKSSGEGESSGGEGDNKSEGSKGASQGKESGTSGQGASSSEGGSSAGESGGEGKGKASGSSGSPGRGQGGETPGGGGGSINGANTEELPTDDGGSASGSSDADPANPEYAREVSNLILDRLDDQLSRGEVDQELLDKLGWSEAEMRQFADRLRSNLNETQPEDSAAERAAREEFQSMLERMSFKASDAPREGRSERIESVEGVGEVNPDVPSEYRDAYNRFTRRAAELGTGRRGEE